MSDTFATVEISLEDLEALQRKAERADRLAIALEGIATNCSYVTPDPLNISMALDAAAQSARDALSQ